MMPISRRPFAPSRISSRTVRRLGIAVPLLLFGGWLGAAPARAEDDDAALRKKLQEQIEKIVRLMKENEEALLRVSTGLADQPKKPEVDLPKPPSGETPEAPKAEPTDGEPGAAPPKGEEPKPGERGEEIRRRIQALLEGQRQTSREIPKALKELVEMLPSQEGGGSGQPKDSKGQTPRPEDQEARDARRRLEEIEKQRKEEEARAAGKEPKSPRDEKDPTRRDPNEPPGGKARDNAPPWLTGLPPEIRDAFANGDFDRIPAPFRGLVRRYLDWLRRQPSSGEHR